ncbi:NAD(P)/FAD-dependent oxidoreductase [Leucobacter zeae]|nr:NAD(P)/FAD-dependent oxidoreductase [Leucobacter zeae]
MTNEIWDTIVIGAGAAGLSAAQALGRSLRRTLVLDTGLPRNRFADRMHNALGNDGTPPAELVAIGRREAERYGVEFRAAAVRAVREATGSGVPGGGARLEVEALGAGDEGSGGEDEPSVFGARAIIVASGATDVLPDIPGVAEHWGGSVLHCPYCHGWEARGGRIGVVTTSPLGMHQARLVRQWSDDVTVFSAGLGELDAHAAAAFAARGVRIVTEPVVEIVGGPAGGPGSGAGVLAVRTADGSEHPVDTVFTASTPVPNDGFLAGLGLRRVEQPMGGDAIAVDAMHRTSHPRVWAVGNVVAPMATVPMAGAAGTFAGMAVNAELVEEDYARAVESARGSGGAS